MAKQLGRLMLVRVGNGAETEVFSVLCGLRSKTLTINNSEIDVTTADCTTPGGVLWTEVLNGVKRVSVTGSGYLDTEVAEQTMNTIAMSATGKANFQIVVPGLGEFAAEFHLATTDYGGEQEDGATYSISMGSSGAVTFTSAA